jgi:hypothetical protein
MQSGRQMQAEIERVVMASMGQQRDADSTSNSVAALGLRRAALRGMLGSPLIETDDQKELREELLNELQTIGQSMARVSARNVSELIAKLDTLNEEYRPGSDNGAVQPLIASIRRDVLALVPRPAERSTVQTIRTLHGSRPSEPPAPAPAVPPANEGNDPPAAS